MTIKSFLDGKVTLHCGDCLDVFKSLPDSSVDSVVTDPPYGIRFMGKAWDGANIEAMIERKKRKGTVRTDGYERNDGAAFAAGTYDVSLTGNQKFQEWTELWAREAFRVLKPGGHIVCFASTRTYHRMATGIEDAGFEIRDQLAWTFGSGFPKSRDVSKAIDKAAGAERTVRLGPKPGHEDFANRKTKGHISKPDANEGWRRPWMDADGAGDYNFQFAPATDAAREWNGWGTALKPAWEPICLARKPLIGTVAQNVLQHGTGALNIDGCRIGVEGGTTRGENKSNAGKPRNTLHAGNFGIEKLDAGRWPANLCHDGSDEVLACFPNSDGAQGDVRGSEPSRTGDDGTNCYGKFNGRVAQGARNDSGSAARFFFTSKAGADDRLGSKHPTVKPLDLMQWLVRLVTPKGGTVLDPFAGTGTTGEAAWREGCRAILIEREAEYQDDIARRMDLVLQPTKRAAVAKTKNKIADHGPLFSTEVAE